MNTGAMYSRNLAELRQDSAIACLATQQRTSRRLIFTLATALELLGIEKPRERQPRRVDGQQWTVVRGNSERTHINGVRFVLWSGPLETVSLAQDQLLCTSPICTWAMYATRLNLEEMVVLGESMMRRSAQLRRASIDDFCFYRDQLQQHERTVRTVRGIRKMNLALRLMQENTDSSQETRTRLALMRYGLDCPQVNHPIRDTKSGKILLLDMAYPEFKIAIEYDGRHHANQWLSDSLRREAIEDAGWIYVQVTSSNLNDESKEELLARRVASKIEQRIRTSVPICARMSIEQVADGRHLNRKPLHEKYVDRIALTPPIE